MQRPSSPHRRGVDWTGVLLQVVSLVARSGSARRAEAAHRDRRRLAGIQRVVDQVPDVQVVRLTDVPDRVERAAVLDVLVGDTWFVHERARKNVGEVGMVT